MDFGENYTAVVPTHYSGIFDINGTATAVDGDFNGTTGYLNVTDEMPVNYARPMYGYVMPFLLLVTIVANTLIVVVLSKRHMRTPTNVVLMSMALSDMFTLLFPAPWLFYMYTLGNHYKPLSPVESCYAWYAMNEVIPTLFHTASIWLTLALAVQRYTQVIIRVILYLLSLDKYGMYYFSVHISTFLKTFDKLS